MSKEIEHVQFVSTCRTIFSSFRHVAGVDGALEFRRTDTTF